MLARLATCELGEPLRDLGAVRGSRQQVLCRVTVVADLALRHNDASTGNEEGDLAEEPALVARSVVESMREYRHGKYPFLVVGEIWVRLTHESLVTTVPGLRRGLVARGKIGCSLSYSGL